MLASVAKTYRLEAASLERDIQTLVDTQQLDGIAKGGFYIPNRFLLMKDVLIQKKFSDQGYLDYDWIEKNFFEKKAKPLIQKVITTKVILLEACAVGQALM
jgi:hypothetical protein